MTSVRELNRSEIHDFFEEEEDDTSDESSSESEEMLDHFSMDDVQSDTEDEFIDNIIDDSDVLSNILDSNELSNLSTSSSNHSSASSNSRIIIPPRRSLRGKNKHKWSSIKGRSRAQTCAINIIRSAKGPSRTCKNIYEPVLCFNLFMTDEIIREIVQWTNAEIFLKRRKKAEKDKLQGKNTINSATFRNVDETEMRALIGILTLTAAMKDNHLSTEEIFNGSFSGSRYVTVMSRDRFDFLIRCLRMDDKTLRPTVREEDPFIPARKVWNLLIIQCINNYTPGPHLTIDEQLLGFRGRSSFRMYIPNKPNEYGIKIPMMCDSSTKYMINAMPYIGKGTKTNGLPLGEYYVKELSKPVHGTCRNITCDNWFTSIPLAKGLLQQPYKLTLVGTIRSNKREIPEELKNTRSRPTGTSMFCFDGPLTLVSYKPKPSKMVYLLSSCDEEGMINESSGKPEMIMYYNQTKGGVAQWFEIKK